jgi:hypothetical protein
MVSTVVLISLTKRVCDRASEDVEYAANRIRMECFELFDLLPKLRAVIRRHYDVEPSWWEEIQENRVRVRAAMFPEESFEHRRT